MSDFGRIHCAGMGTTGCTGMFRLRRRMRSDYAQHDSGEYALLSPEPPLWLSWCQMDERDFFDEKEARKPHTLTCPNCRTANEYELNWLVRTKKRQLPGRADERDRAKFAKAQSYMVRRDDMVMCKNMRCRKRFEVAGVQSVAFID